MQMKNLVFLGAAILELCISKFFINDLPSKLLHSNILLYADVRNFPSNRSCFVFAWCRHILLFEVQSYVISQR